MLQEVRLDIVEMHVDHRLDLLLRGLAEQRHASEHELDQQRRHQRAFRIVQEVPVAQHSVAMRRRTKPPVGLFDQILDDRPGFRDGAAKAPIGLVIDDHRRLAERMHRTKLRRSEHRRLVPFVALDPVGQAKLFEQPQYALRTRILQMVDGDHRPVILADIAQSCTVGKGMTSVKSGG